MAIYCYDTEFLDNGRTIELISIGIVCDDGREYYAVNADMDKKRITANDWLMKHVVPQLPLNGKIWRDMGQAFWSLDTRNTLVKPKLSIANEVRDFLLANGAPELWAYYAAYDHVALAQLWGPMMYLPKGIPMWTHDLMQLIEPLTGFEKPTQDGNEHNALADARWNMQLLNAARGYAHGDH